MSAVWVAAILCVAAMGYAIQRGGTCTVAAVDEILNQHSARRLLAMLEASLWVAGGLLLAQLGHLMGSMPAGYATTAWTVIGGALLGFGAWINRACVFGAVARLGSGEWAYVLTPLGFFVGCASVMPLFPRPPASALADASPLFAASNVLAAAFVLFVFWRLGSGLWRLRGQEPAVRLHERIWAPHAATIVIGVSFVVTLLLAGRWAYTDVLADLARTMGGAPAALGLPVLLVLALYAGALVGGGSAGRLRLTRVPLLRCLRCFAGGVIMGWGSLLIPGSNDGLILIGIPLLRPYAWLGFASMVVAIAGAMLAQRHWDGRNGNLLSSGDVPRQ
jgi:toxin CptA